MPPQIHRRLIPLAALAWLLLGLAASGQVTTRSVTNAAQLGTIDPRSVSSDDRAVVVIGDPTGADQGTFVYGKTSARSTNAHSVIAADTDGQFLRVLPWQDERILRSPWLSAQAFGLTNLWTLGDSHTVGQINIAGSSNWVDGGFIKAAYRYPNILAARYGLTLSNLAVSGSAISSGMAGAALADLSPTLQQLGKVGPNWAGVLTVMAGYNDGLNWQDAAQASRWFESAWAATIATAFATNWANASGTMHGGSGVSGWSTGGSVETEATASTALFPTASGITAARTALKLTAGQSWAATLGGRIGLILDRWPSGGVVSITTNGSTAGQLVLDTMGNGYAQTQRRLPTLFDVTVPAGSTVGISSISGTNYLLGVVWIGSETDAWRKRLILSGSAPLGDTAIRSDGLINMIGASLARAAQRFAGYPVYVAAAGSAIDPDSDVYAGDLSHPGPAGQAKFAAAFDAATRANAAAAGAAMASVEQPVVRSSGGIQAFGSGLGADYSRPSASLFYVPSYGAFLDAQASGIGNWDTLNIRAYATRLTSGGLMVEGTAPNFGWLPTTPYIGLAVANSVGYLDAYASGTTQVPIPMRYRAVNHGFANGAVSILSNSPTTDDLPALPGLHLSQVAGTNFIDALLPPSTYLTTIQRARSHRFDNGSVSILGNAATIDYLPTNPGMHLSQVAGTNFIDALQAPSTWLPLTVRASTVRVTTGALQVSGGTGLGGLAAEKSVIFYDDGTSAFVRGYDSGAAYIPLVVDGASVDSRVSGNLRAQVDSGASTDVSPFLLYDARNDAMKRVNIGATGTAPGNGRALFIDGTPGGPSQLPPYTTAARDALVVGAGAMIWNTTTSKAQVYTGSAWVDLH